MFPDTLGVKISGFPRSPTRYEYPAETGPPPALAPAKGTAPAAGLTMADIIELPPNPNDFIIANFNSAI